MILNIVIGWWAAPALVTLVVYVLAWRRTVRDADHRELGPLALLYMMMATIVSLAAWLGWALLLLSMMMGAS